MTIKPKLKNVGILLCAVFLGYACARLVDSYQLYRVYLLADEYGCVPVETTVEEGPVPKAAFVCPNGAVTVVL